MLLLRALPRMLKSCFRHGTSRPELFGSGFLSADQMLPIIKQHLLIPSRTRSPSWEGRHAAVFLVDHFLNPHVHGCNAEAMIRKQHHAASDLHAYAGAVHQRLLERLIRKAAARSQIKRPGRDQPCRSQHIGSAIAQRAGAKLGVCCLSKLFRGGKGIDVFG